MAYEITFAGIFVLVCILAFCAAGVIQEELGRRAVRSQLRAPLLHEARGDSTNAIGRRVEVAVREARAGYRRCGLCDFTNPRRAVTCVICGAKLPRDQPASQPRSSAATTKSKPLSWRQKRVRKRKEWVRHVNDDGTIVWRRNSDNVANADLNAHAFPSYVLHTQSAVESQDCRSEEATNPTPPEDCEDANDHIEIVIPEETAIQVAASLERELAQTQICILEAQDAGPVQSVVSPTASVSTPATLQEIRDTVASANLDFPTKLAQFITAASMLFLDANGERDSADRTISRFSVTRTSLLTDSINAVATMTPTSARAAIRVDFKGEQGIDAGGVYREWFLLMNEKLLAPEAGLFVCVDPKDQSFYLNPHSKELLGESHLAHFLAAGRLLGRALMEGNVTGFHLALPLLKIILGLPVSVSDLEYLDPEVFTHLTWLLEHDGVDALCLDFTVTQRLPSGETRVVELVPGGADIDVTDANKHEFVDRKLKFLLFERVHDQLFAFLKGLYEVVPMELLMLFDAEELDYVLSGSDEIDVDDWERNTITSKNLADHPALANFWQCVRALSIDDRRRMLQFATGATRVPPGGFSALTSYDGRLCPFRLRGVKPLCTRGYIRSHACFNHLDLPLHLEATEMRFALAAVLSNRSFGFTTA